jgi:tetratricopeptide (TPR) repeat protein
MTREGLSLDAVTGLRLAGRWDEALETLAGRDDLDAARERVIVLADKNMIAGSAGEELDAAIDALAEAGAGDRRIEAFVLTRRGAKLHSTFLADRSAGEPPGEMHLFEEALAVRREIGDEPGIAESLFYVGLVHQVVRDDSPTSLPYFRESYERAKAGGDDLLASYAIRHIAFATHQEGDFDQAEAEFRESLELRQQVGWVPGVAAAEFALAELLRERGRADEALALARSAHDTFASLGSARFVVAVESEFPEIA